MAEASAADKFGLAFARLAEWKAQRFPGSQQLRPEHCPVRNTLPICAYTLPNACTPYIVSALTTRTPKPKVLPEWSRAEPFQKLAEAYTSIERMGGQVFTLRLNKKDHDQIVASKDPARAMSRRINSAFRKRGLRVPFYSFCLEVTADDRNDLHVHGAIVIGRLRLDQVKDALRDAGGRIGGHAGSRQVKVDPFEDERGGPTGWANYTKKSLARTRRVIQHNRVIYIPQQLSRVCKPVWDQRRGQQVRYNAA